MKVTIIIFLLGLSSGFALKAQELSEKQLRGLERISDEAKRAEHHKKYLKKDSIRHHKHLADTLKQKANLILKDSISNYLPDVAIDSTLIDKQAKKIKSIAKDSRDSYIPGGLSLDSTATDHLKQKAKVKATETLEDVSGTEIPDITVDSTTTDRLKKEGKAMTTAALEEASGMELSEITIDSTTTDKIKKESVKRAEDVLKNTDEYEALSNLPQDTELSKMGEYKVKVEQTQEEIRQAATKKELKKKMATHVKEYIQEHAEKIQQVQEQMGSLKRKYSYVPNSNDLSTAVKRSSLKGESFWKRLVLGGNFNISKTNPLNIDLSPVVGYKINKLFEVGVTGAFRTQFTADKTGINAQRDKEVYGYSIFANHLAFKNFFGYLEGELMRTARLNDEDQQRVWKETLLIGIGRKIGVAKWLEMQAMVLFNVLHDNQDGLYNSPVVFKTGFRARK